MVELIHFLFFFCSENSNGISTVKGTPAFMAPELLLPLVISVSPFACDMYSIGACLFMFVEGRPPYWERNEIDMVERLRRGVPPSFSNQVMSRPNLKNLLLALLAKNPTQRIQLRQVVQHQWTTMEDSQPMYETDALMEAALKDQSVQCRLDLNAEEINKGMHMLLVVVAGCCGVVDC